MGSGGGTANSVAEFKPPAYTQDYWQNYVQQAANLTSQAPTMYQGQRVADLSPQHLQAMDLVTQRATNGAPDLNAARGQAMQTAQGAYLNANPYSANPWTDRVIANNTGNMAEGFAAGTAAQNAALANMQGAFGGSGYTQKQAMDAGNLAKQIGQMADTTRMNQTNLASGNWEQERARQLQASGLAGQLAQDDWTAGQQLAGVGDMQRGYQTENMNSLYNTWKEGQMAPFQNLDIFRNALSAASGGMGTNTTYQTAGGFSPLAGLLGAGAIGYGLYNS